MTRFTPASQDLDQPTFGRRRALQVLVGLPFAVAALSLAGCADMRGPRPTRPPNSGGGGPNRDGGGVGGRK